MDGRRPDWEQGPDSVEERLNEADRTLSDLDQTLSGRDQMLSNSDQTQSDRDQHASDYCDAASDRGRDDGVDSAFQGRPRAIRAETTQERMAIGRLRDEIATERDQGAQKRDERAAQRDRNADSADQRALELDASDMLSDRRTRGVREIRARGVEGRKRSGRDQERAARDRMHSARDRRLGALDREESKQDREHAGIDELTGARRRGSGLDALGNEMQRARREGNSLVAAYVDVDGLKFVNDEHGHAAGDQLLITVAEGMRHCLRSYDLLVRLGGDEFLCALPKITMAEARQRFDDLRAELLESVGSSVSVGFSELLDSDSPDRFVARADSDLLAHRGG